MTRNRPDAFSLCEKWMAQQTKKWKRWIVVNDSCPEQQDAYHYTMDQEVIKRANDGDTETSPIVRWSKTRAFVPLIAGRMHSLCANWLVALERVAKMHSKVFVVSIEDDDYYAPPYLEHMAELLADNNALVGLWNAYYYNIAFSSFRRLHNMNHASLACTAFSRNLFPFFKEVCLRGNPYIDGQLWSGWTAFGKPLTNTSRLDDNIQNGLPLSIGIKGWGYNGLPGQQGVSEPTHNGENGYSDTSWQRLKEWTKDWRTYWDFVQMHKTYE
jgi:hypothetical protein